MPRFGLRKLSAYARADSHLAQQTSYGAVVTLLGAALALILLLDEISQHRSAARVSTLGVDTTRGEHLRIWLDITLPALPCAALSLDAIDISGSHEDDNTFSLTHDGDIHKIRLSGNGKRLGEYITPKQQWGPFMMRRPQEENAAMNAEFDKHEGCNVNGWIEVQRVAGNFHLSVHADHYFAMKSTQEEIQKVVQEQIAHHELNRNLQVPTGTSSLNMSHIVHKLAFGPSYPGQVNPLDGYSQISQSDTGTFKYFIKVVPTDYHKWSGKPIHSNQYSMTEYYTPVRRGEASLPAIYFLYDLSPIMVVNKDARGGVAHLLVRICAVVGGVFAVTGICDRWVHWFITMTRDQEDRHSYAAS